MIHWDMSADFQMKSRSLLNKHSADWHHIEFMDSLIAHQLNIIYFWNYANIYSCLSHAIGYCGKAVRGEFS